MGNIIHMGIDVGYGNTKGPTVVMGSGVTKLPMQPPITSNVVVYNGEYYSIGGSKTDIQRSKFEDENTLIATMAVIAKELKKLGRTTGEMRLGIGLPLTRMGAEKDDYYTYMLHNRRLNFDFEGKSYSVYIISVDVFPQGYAAVISKLNTFGPSAVVVDIGSWTVDILPLTEGQPDMTKCKSLQIGAITAINDINEALRQKFGEEADVAFIKDVMINGTSKMDEDYLAVIQEGLRKYVENIMNTLRSLRFNSKLTHFVIIGGGACIVKNFIDDSSYKMTIIDDVCINAKGYVEILDHKYKED